jgi:hypothetical protein
MLSFAERLTVMADFLLLLALSLFVILGLVSILKFSLKALIDYFSSAQRLQRKLLFLQNRKDTLHKQQYFKSIQLRYFNDLKRKHLLKLDNRRQSLALARLIQKSLNVQKKHIPTALFKQWQLEQKLYRQQQDMLGLIQLQQKITNYEADKEFNR